MSYGLSAVSQLNVIITVTTHKHHDIANQYLFDFVANSFSKLATNRTSKVCITYLFVKGIHQLLADSPHKGTVMQKAFPFHDIIMWWGCTVVSLHNKCGDCCILYAKWCNKIRSHSLIYLHSIFIEIEKNGFIYGSQRTSNSQGCAANTFISYEI